MAFSARQTTITFEHGTLKAGTRDISNAAFDVKVLALDVEVFALDTVEPNHGTALAAHVAVAEKLDVKVRAHGIEVLARDATVLALVA